MGDDIFSGIFPAKRLSALYGISMRCSWHSCTSFWSACMAARSVLSENPCPRIVGDQRCASALVFGQLRTPKRSASDAQARFWTLLTLLLGSSMWNERAADQENTS